MELNKIMRLIWQGLLNLPENAPEREKTIEAFGALESHLQYKMPNRLIRLQPDGYTKIEYIKDNVKGKENEKTKADY